MKAFLGHLSSQPNIKHLRRPASKSDKHLGRNLTPNANKIGFNVIIMPVSLNGVTGRGVDIGVGVATKRFMEHGDSKWRMVNINLYYLWEASLHYYYMSIWGEYCLKGCGSFPVGACGTLWAFVMERGCTWCPKTSGASRYERYLFFKLMGNDEMKSVALYFL